MLTWSQNARNSISDDLNCKTFQWEDAPENPYRGYLQRSVFRTPLSETLCLPVCRAMCCTCSYLLKRLRLGMQLQQLVKGLQLCRVLNINKENRRFCFLLLHNNVHLQFLCDQIRFSKLTFHKGTQLLYSCFCCLSPPKQTITTSACFDNQSQPYCLFQIELL